MQLIKLAKTLCRLNRQLPKVENPNWTKEEAQALQRFLASPLGVKLKSVIFSWIVKQSLASIDRGADKAEFNVGYSSGFRDGIGCLDTLVQNGLLISDDE